MRERRRPARRGEGAVLRGEIIEAATREVARTGDASALSLRGLARVVGIATTSIYLHFKSIAELLEEVRLARFEQFNAILVQAADAAGDDPTARVLARARAYVRFWEEHPGEYTVMFTARPHPETGGPPRVLRAAAAVDEVARDVARAWGQSPRADGSRADGSRADRPPAEATLCAFHLWAGLHGMLSLRTVRPHLPCPDLDVEVSDLVERLLRSGSQLA